MSKSEEDNYIIEMYFGNALLEIQDGLPKEILQETLEYYEEQELYLACAGIKKALDWFDTQTFTKTMVQINEIIKDDDLSDLNYSSWDED
jgi:hypothetical protein|tara:strand:+ start:1279 stop:1548 length:270 start_codon:yes stop_codon:yes gene_type:complete